MDKKFDEKELSLCDECESEYYTQTSKMSSLCPQCAHVLYGYENCLHEFHNTRCIKCFWNGNIPKKLNNID